MWHIGLLGSLLLKLVVLRRWVALLGRLFLVQRRRWRREVVLRRLGGLSLNWLSGLGRKVLWILNPWIGARKRHEALPQSSLGCWLLGWRLLIALLGSLFLNRVYRGRRRRGVLLRRLRGQRMNRFIHRRIETLLTLNLWRRSNRGREALLVNRLGRLLLGRRRWITRLGRLLLERI